MAKLLSREYSHYTNARLAGGFGEMGSWPLVMPYLAQKRCLDIGCSDGLYLKYLTQESVGIEQAGDLVETARAKGLNVIQGDILDTLATIQSETFDAVLFSHVLEHLECPIEALKQVNRILRRDGTLVLGLPIENCAPRKIFRYDYFGGTHIYSFTINNAKKLLCLTHFRAEKTFFHIPKFRGKIGIIVNTIWNSVPVPGKEWFSMAYWIIALKTGNIS